MIDPGPDVPEHLAAITAAAGTSRIIAILCTHTHRDHSPASRPLQGMTGAPIVGCAPLAPSDAATRADAAFDAAYRPDRAMADGETLAGAGWTLAAVATPGHTSNHLCFALPEADGLFSGDHVMGWSTTVVAPPDGDMGAYLGSLERLLSRDEATYWPGHGEPVARPRRYVAGLLAHRRAREAQIVALLAEGAATPAAMLPAMYPGLDGRLHGAARASIAAHLLELARRGLAVRDGEEWHAA